MSLKLNFVDKQEPTLKIRMPLVPRPEPEGVRVKFAAPALKVKKSDNVHSVDFEVKARKNLAGNIVMYEHPEVDIVIDPKKSKVSVVPKDKISDDSYDIQDKVFKFLIKRGIVDPASVQSASAYGILQGIYFQNDEVPTLGILIYQINRFIKLDKDNYVYDEVFEKMEQEMLDPKDDRSTELGEIPHEEMQGALRPGYIYPYGTYGAMGLYRI